MVKEMKESIMQEQTTIKSTVMEKKLKQVEILELEWIYKKDNKQVKYRPAE